ncbi:MAG: DUF1207 domain-containing protein [Bacteroidetes bacterium]|nr:DUF1207 domain-containing protein [Bacteroidota bacterium]
MKLLIAICLSTIFFMQLHAQEDIRTPSSRLLFAPLIAHHVEPRVGFTRLVDEDRLQLDIGNSIDLLEFAGPLDTDRIAVGVDVFTWTSLRQEEAFHFPVDAVDYLFGINTTYRQRLDAGTALSARLRLSHISAHLVDGSYSKETGAWRDGLLPRVYSREFLDLILAWEYRDLLRLYAGGQYIYHIDPPDLGKFGLQAGAETVWQEPLWAAVHFYAAYDFRLLDTGALRAAHGVQIGGKLGPWRGKGLRFFLELYHGPSQHGEYFDFIWSYWGYGMNIDF